MIEAAIHHHLITDAANLAIVGADGVWPIMADQDTEPPYQVYMRVGGAHEQEIENGPVTITTARFQIDSYSDDYDQMKAMEDAVRIAFDGHNGLTGPVAQQVDIRQTEVVDMADGFEAPNDGSETGVYRSRIDIEIVYNEAIT